MSMPGRGSRAVSFAAGVITVGTGTGALVRLLLDRNATLPEVGASAIVGMLYTVVMGGTLSSAARIMGRRVPLRSRAAVALHVVVQVVLTIVSFFVATGLAGALFPFARFTGNQIGVVATVAIGGSFIISSLFYSSAFLRRSREAERAAIEAELRALRAQIAPHFLFNALNSIVALIRTSPAAAEEMTLDLADLFRYTLRSSERPIVSLAEELEAVRLYLQIERARFSDRLTLSFDCDGDLAAVKVPSLSVQTLVENAIKHGGGAEVETFRIDVRARRHGARAVVSVEDSGPGFGNSQGGDGHGLRNIRERLRLAFGPEAELRWSGSRVEMTLPVREERS